MISESIKKGFRLAQIQAHIKKYHNAVCFSGSATDNLELGSSRRRAETPGQQEVTYAPKAA